MNDEIDATCCVCLEPTATLTPCAHYLCTECYGKLRKNVCPLCRRQLLGGCRDPASASTQRLIGLPALHGANIGQRTIQRHQIGQRTIQRHQRASYRVLLCCELARFKNIEEAVACAEEACPHFRNANGNGSGRAEAAAPREAISRAVAQHLEREQLASVVRMASRIADLLHDRVFAPELVLPAIRSVVRRSVTTLRLTSASPAEEIVGIVDQLLALRRHEAFFPFVEGVAPQIARKVVEAVKLSFLNQPVDDFMRCKIAVERWPSAQACLGDALHEVIRNRLILGAQEMAMNPRSRPLTDMVETLKVVTSCGLLDHPSATHICDELVPYLVRQNVKTQSTISWAAAESGPVVARQLVAKLFDCSSDVHLSADGSDRPGSVRTNFLHLERPPQ